MGKANPEISIPGAPTAAASVITDQTGPGADSGPDPRDAEIAALRAQLAAKNAPAGEQLVMQADGPNIRKHMAESKHMHLTTTELNEQVRAGKVKLIDHHVLCKDGWFVNPAANVQANG